MAAQSEASEPSRDVEVGKRLLEHIAAGTTDCADEVTRIPVSWYLDPALWEREMQNIFRRLPLMLAFSVEVAEPGDTKAMDVAGVPVLMRRGRDGVARAFLNVCSHRGARLQAEGISKCPRLVCPYHAWAYDDEGALAGIYKSELFGELDRKTKGLTALPCEEHAGLLFVVLTPGLPIDVKRYLGEMLDDLATLGIDRWHVYARRELESANWKATHDGYVDGYHLEVLHPKTVGLFTKGAVNTFDSCGPHQRIGFANHDIEKLREIDSGAWQQDEGFGFVRTLFPNISFAVRAGGGGLVSQLLPGPTPDRSRTIQTYLRAQLPETDEEKQRADLEVEMFYAAVRDEDYATVAGVQQGMESGAIDEVVLGRNELGNQRLHRWIEYYSQDEPRPADRPEI
jgi:phenylpropionate dioxygenase-like ring-hydroxylating dioxygenase large terminal subunit